MEFLVVFNPIFANSTNIDAGSPAFEVMMLAPWVVAMRMPNLLYEVATPWHATGGRRGGEGEKALVEKKRLKWASTQRNFTIALKATKR